MAKKKKRKNGVRNVLLVLIAIMIAAIAVMVYLCVQLVSAPQQPQTSVPTETIPFATVPATEAPTVPPTTAPPEPEHVVSTATILSTGDLLMHGQLLGALFLCQPLYRCDDDIAQLILYQLHGGSPF